MEHEGSEVAIVGIGAVFREQSPSMLGYCVYWREEDSPCTHQSLGCCRCCQSLEDSGIPQRHTTGTETIMMSQRAGSRDSDRRRLGEAS